MWEIRVRKLPYDDRSFSSFLDLKAAFLGGMRSTVSENGDADYVKLMCDCWVESSLGRPTFCQVVASRKISANCVFFNCKNEFVFQDLETRVT